MRPSRRGATSASGAAVEYWIAPMSGRPFRLWPKMSVRGAYSGSPVDRIDAADDGGTPSAPIVSRASRSVAHAVPVRTTFAIHVPRPQPAPAARETMLFATMGRAASATSAQPSVRQIELIRPERIVLLTIFTPVGAYV